MHPLHDHLATQLAGRIKARRVVVWYDPRGEFADFIAELGVSSGSGVQYVSVGGADAALVRYEGSMFELRAEIEPYVAGSEPATLVAYISGFERDRKGSILMEVEEAGDCYEPRLKAVARTVLRKDYTDDQIDDLLASETVTYADLVRAIEDGGTEPSLLKAIYPDVYGSEAILASWLADASRDAEIEAKGARPALLKLIRSRVGCDIGVAVSLAKARAILARYLLAAEFRSDLGAALPGSVEAVPAPRTKEELAIVREVLRRLRTDESDAYESMADAIEAELGLAGASVQADALGTIDTFRFEERVLLQHCAERIAAGDFVGALEVAEDRTESFWLGRDVERRAQWEAARRMAELGACAERVIAALKKAPSTPGAWVTAYAAQDGWASLDSAQRRLETFLSELADEPDPRALGAVRQLYHDACRSMAEGFTDALISGKWDIGGVLSQTRVWPEIVEAQAKPVAYFLVDAMRFEMGRDLEERLLRSGDVILRPAVAALPTITPIGMAALHPGASVDMDIAQEGGHFGSRIDGTFLPDLTARKKYAHARIPGLVDMTLDEVISESLKRLTSRVSGAPVVMVRSQEIDAVGEGGSSLVARKAMDRVIDDVARAIRKLAKAGVTTAVVSADHGHLHYPTDLDEAMRVEAPSGDTMSLHRRCWVGRGGATPPGCIRVSAADIGYAADVDLVFPRGLGVFKTGGDLAFHHGGISLQEMVVPVLVARTRLGDTGAAGAAKLVVSGVPDLISNRIFGVTVQLGGDNVAMFPEAKRVQPILVSGTKQVGALGMATGAEVDQQTKTVVLEPAKPVSIAFMLSDAEVKSLRIVVLDPATDAELYRSPVDIPVELMI